MEANDYAFLFKQPETSDNTSDTSDRDSINQCYQI